MPQIGGQYTMRSTTRLLIATLAATALFAVLATTAPARSFSVSNQNIRVVFRPLILTSGTGDRVSCTVTLEATFHYRTFIKVERSLIGNVTRAIVETPTCRSTGASTGIRARVLSETLPWHLRYISFLGRLPDVSIRIRLLRAGLDLINVPILGTCKYSVTNDDIIGIGTGLNANFIVQGGLRVPSSTAFCPEVAWETEFLPIWQLGTTREMQITLI
jgi:hypothetical protein